MNIFPSVNSRTAYFISFLLVVGFLSPQKLLGQLVDTNNLNASTDVFLNINDSVLFHTTNVKPSPGELNAITEWKRFSEQNYQHDSTWLIAKIKFIKNDNNYILRLDDEVSFVQAIFLDKESKIIDIQKSGYALNNDQKKLIFGFYSLIEIDNSDTEYLYLIIDSRRLVRFPELNIINKTTFLEQRSQVILRTSIFCSMLVIMAFYNLIVYLRIKRSIFLYYFTLIISLCVFVAHPITSNFIPFGQSMFLVVLGICGVNISSIQFTLRYLNLKNTLKGPHYIYTILNYLFVLFSIVYFLTFSVFEDSFTPVAFTLSLALMTLLNVSMNIFTAFLGLKHKIKNSGSYIIANLLFMLGAMVYILIWVGYIFNYIEVSFVTSNIGNYAFLIGATSQVLLYSLVMSNFIIDIQNDKMKLQLALNKKLEGTVELKEHKLEMAESRIQMQSDEINNLGFLKDKLMAILSHDLKSPLNSLNGILTLFENQNISKQEFEAQVMELRKILNNTTTLSNNLIHWSKSQMQGLVPKTENIDLVGILESILELFSPNLKSKNIEIQLLIKEQVLLSTDIQMTEIVLRNIISNAIKFSKKGGKIEITGKEQNSTYLLIIQDYGVGMEVDFLKSLMEHKNEVSIAGTNNEMGTGLGLQLCFEMMELNNGSMEIESILNQGTKVYLTFNRLFIQQLDKESE